MSKYNIYVNENSRFYVFNQLSGALIEVDEELFRCLKNNEIEKINASEELFDEMRKAHFICDENLNEELIVLSANKMFRFANNVARVTILPTIDCNFRCWYCYESHIESKMSEGDVWAVITFCKNILNGGAIKKFHLDWFGGEPLLYFDEIMYPISKEIKSICENLHVQFSHSITTNGYLISENMINKLNEIELTSYQITLDGSEFYHNRTRFSESDKHSYSTIVKNIILLCRHIRNVDMAVRINYTPKNINSIDKIAYDFPMDVRHKILIQPQLVWQFKNVINEISDVIKEKLDIFIKEGYKRTNVSIPHLFNCCYVENMNQYVVNYDLSVYKCTARNFVDKKFSIGKILENGELMVNSNYYNYFISSYMENSTCLSCEYLPSCCGVCIQKKVEGQPLKCPKEDVRKSLLNRINLLILNL